MTETSCWELKMFCGKCGRELNPGASFCPKCGARVSGSGTPSTSAPGSAAGIGTPASGPTGFGTPLPSMPVSMNPTGSGAAYGAVGGATAPVPSTTSGSFTLRIAEGVISCLNIILALVLPVLSVTIPTLASMQMNVFDALQAPARLEEMMTRMTGSSMSSLGGGMSTGGSAAGPSAFSSLAAVCGFIGFVLVVAVACSAVTAFLCFTKNSEKPYPTVFAMVVYAIVLIGVLTVVSNQLASQLSDLGGGFVDVSGLFKLEIGMGVWVSLIGGIACVVLDFLRASRAKSESA